LVLETTLMLERLQPQVYLPNQKILETEEGCESVLQYIPDEDVKAEVRSKWGESRNQTSLHFFSCVYELDIALEERVSLDAFIDFRTSSMERVALRVCSHPAIRFNRM
jgi:hypothetical protein